MNKATAREADFWSTTAWRAKLGGWFAVALTSSWVWPFAQKLGEDAGLFGEKSDRFGPVVGAVLRLLGNPAVVGILGATVALFVGIAYGRWMQGAIHEDGPDKRFRVTSPDELSSSLGIEVLGHTYVLPRGVWPKEALKDPRSGYSETLGRIASCFIRWTRGFEGKVVAITGDRPAVGKTSTTVGLGCTLASFGKRVLIVDCDLRNPSLHRVVELDNDVGFSLVAAGALSPDLAIRPTAFFGLDAMTAGPLPPTPAANVANSRADQWLRDQAKHYDFILIDTPPLAFAEVLQIIDLADAFIYVVEHGSNLRAARTVLDQLRRMSDRRAATMMSKVPSRGEISWGGYDYSYDYSYGDEGQSGTKVTGDSAGTEPTAS